MTMPPKKPLFPLGEPIGELTVVKHLGHSRTCPEGIHQGKHYNKSQWWYRLRCKCGNHVVATQDALRDKRRRCDECNSEQRAFDQRRRMRAKYPKPVSSVPDFARMKLR